MRFQIRLQRDWLVVLDPALLLSFQIAINSSFLASGRLDCCQPFLLLAMGLSCLSCSPCFLRFSVDPLLLLRNTCLFALHALSLLALECRNHNSICCQGLAYRQLQEPFWPIIEQPVRRIASCCNWMAFSHRVEHVGRRSTLREGVLNESVPQQYFEPHSQGSNFALRPSLQSVPQAILIFILHVSLENDMHNLRIVGLEMLKDKLP
mmetsp:Transcript_97573/g.183447  ORF Transcript_97573/g.183447 Transcript_97573/m.183447 type:complete len:207 (-) Transcript_97573:25-645(-)